MPSNSQDSLMLAILAMDAYNRDYYASVDMSATGNRLGGASVGLSSTYFMKGADKSAGFYAISYTYNEQTIISYQGTDNQSVWYDPISGAGDILNGWTIGAGFAAASQAALAEQFYNDITTQTVFGGPAPSNLVLTGHSLGGGLAGFVAGYFWLGATPMEGFSSVWR